MRPRRRWHRIAIPLGLFGVIVLGTFAVHEISEPKARAAHYLAPDRHEPVSGGKLADMLRAKGVTIRHETRAAQALSAAWEQKGEATLFVPSPQFVHLDYLYMMRQSPPGTRIVLVEPGLRQVVTAVPLVVPLDERWTAAVAEPGPECTITSAGRAAVRRTGYLSDDEAKVCYGSGLVAREFRNVEFIVAGSADPFRSDRLSEHDNATLAVDLLGKKKTLVWLDLHAMEPKPKTYNEELPGAGRPIPSLQPGDELTRPDASPRPTESNQEAVPGIGFGQSGDPTSPFPPWLIPAAVMLLLIAIMVALARARRLGAPVPEPLPIDVPAAETAIGRSRLYRRAKARGAALEMLRIEARRRIAASRAVPDEKQAILAVRPDYEYLLYGPVPETDDELIRLAEMLREA